MRVIKLKNLEELWKSRQELLRLSLKLRPGHTKRRVRRSIEDSLKLALLTKEASELFLEVISWKERRVLKLRKS